MKPPHLYTSKSRVVIDGGIAELEESMDIASAVAAQSPSTLLWRGPPIRVFLKSRRIQGAEPMVYKREEFDGCRISIFVCRGRGWRRPRVAELI